MTFVRKFYISDTHFMHEKLLTMQPRPFKTIDRHDEHLVECWNSVVGKKDIVYHLGDVAFRLADRADRVKAIFDSLNGVKYLVMGNHDLDDDGHLHPALARLDWADRPEFVKIVRDEGYKVVLSHYAHREWQGKFGGAVHFYGHSHSKLPPFERSRDVGVDMEDVAWTPRTFKELTKGMELAK